MSWLQVLGFRCRAVIFDMDGVVIDSEGTYVDAWQRAAESLGYNGYDSMFQRFRGLEYAAIELRLQAELGADFPVREFAGISAEIWHERMALQGMPILPGFTVFYKKLKTLGIPVALATNSHLPNARKCLQLAGLEDHFPVIATADQVSRGKPDPAVFLLAAERLALQPEECLVIEDTVTGLQAAAAAGMNAICMAALSSPPGGSGISTDFNTVYSYGELERASIIVSE